MRLTTALLGFFLALLSLVEAKSKADSAILLSKVKSLTLHGDKKTSHRRVSAIPQLTCVGGNGCTHYSIDLMRCQNAGSEYDAEDIQWTCSASLPPEFKLGSTEVVCEGYDNADDPWVLKGSCGVEYRLLLTEEGERKYAKSKPRYGSKQDEHYTQSEESASIQNPVAKFLFWLAFIGIVCLILYRIFNPPNGNGAIRLNGNNRPGWGGGGGGGDDPFDDPPPPYSPRPPTRPYAKPSSSRTTTAGSSRSAGARSGPGFWTGAAAGGAAAGAAGYGAGYYQGSRAAEAERRERERQRASTGSWFGSGSRSGSNGGGSFSGAGSSSPGPSSSRHESTGFGGTRRR